LEDLAEEELARFVHSGCTKQSPLGNNWAVR